MSTAPRSALSLGLLLGMTLASLSCRDEDKADPSPNAEPDPAEFRAEAHRAAYGRLLPLAKNALIEADPVAAWRRGLAEPRPPPLSATRHAEIQSAYEAAWKEAVDIDAEVLEPTEAMMLTAIRFALARMHDANGAHDPSRRSLEWSIREVQRFVANLEWVLTEAPCPSCSEALGALPAELDAATRSLGAASRSDLIAAQADLKALKDRVRNLPERALAPSASLEESSTTVQAKLDALLLNVKAWLDQLPSQPTSAWQDPVPPARAKAPVARLPDRLGSEILRRRLDVEEGITGSAEHFFRRLGPALGRLHAMAEGTAEDAAQTPSPVTLERCRPVLTKILAFAQRHPQLGVHPMDCERLIRLWGDESMTDAEVSVEVARWGVLEPARLARLRDEAPVLGLITGRITPKSHALTTTVAILAGMKDGPGASLAIGQAIEAACLAATALWVHGELGTDEALTTRLKKECPQRAPSEWIAQAEARPRAALAGMGLAHLGTGPAEVVALERYWWAPLGLVPRLANPKGEDELPPAVDVRIEPIVPEPSPNTEPERPE